MPGKYIRFQITYIFVPRNFIIFAISIRNSLRNLDDISQSHIGYGVYREALKTSENLAVEYLKF